MLYNRKRTFNPEILNKPFELGYICGLLATDGNLHERDKCISLALHKNDEETVRYFGNLTILEKDFDVNYTRNLVRVAICSKVFFKSLVDLGITPRKSKALNINFNNTFNELTFLLGAIDGDGYVSKNEIRIYTASELFANQLVDKFKGRKYWDNESVYIISWKGIHAFNLSHLLPIEYSRMTRKSEKILQLRNLRSKRGNSENKYIYFDKKRKRFQVRINKLKCGEYRTLEEALIVRNMKIKELNISCYYCDTEALD